MKERERERERGREKEREQMVRLLSWALERAAARRRIHAHAPIKQQIKREKTAIITTAYT